VADASVKLKVEAPTGVREAADGFSSLAKAASDAAKSVRAAQSAGSAYMNQIGRENRETKKAGRKESHAQRVREIEEAAAQRHRDEEKAHKEASVRHARRAGVISATGRGGAMGAMGAIGGKAGVAGAVIGAIGEAMGRAATAVELLQDSYQTGAQKMRGLISEFVPLGDKVIKLGDALDGTTDQINRQREGRQIASAQSNAEFGFRGRYAAGRLEDVGYKAQAFAAGRIGLAGYDTFDRTTLAGERGAQRQDTTIGAQDDSTRANREAMAARIARQAAADAVTQADKRVRDQQAKVAAAEGDLRANTRLENRGFRDKAGRDRAAGQVELERDRLTRELQAREMAVAQAKEKGLAAVQAEAQARAASVGLAKAELAVLEQQESRMRSLAQGVGAMSQGERIAAANALKAYQDGGGEAPPEIEALIAKIAPDLVRKNQERRGAGFLENDLSGVLGDGGMKAAFGDDFGKGNTLKEIMAKVDKAKADIRVTIDLDAQAMANQLATLLKPVLENLAASFRVELKNLEGRIKAGNIVRSNAAN
jgi:hypothetical protein